MLINSIFHKFQLDEDSQGKDFITKNDIGKAIESFTGELYHQAKEQELELIMSTHDIFGNNKISKDDFYTIFDNDDDMNIAKKIKSKVTNILKKKENIELNDEEKREKIT